jgi:hypothetical protein
MGGITLILYYDLLVFFSSEYQQVVFYDFLSSFQP